MVDQACLFISAELKLSGFLAVCCGLGFFCLVLLFGCFFNIFFLILGIPHAHSGNLFHILNSVKNFLI